MTVTYSDKSFLQLLFRWKGSIWKTVGRHYLIWLGLYAIIQLIYRLVLPYANVFERCVLMFDVWSKTIPLTFLLGFYVSNVVSRWWDQLNQVSFPDEFLLFVAANFNKNDKETRIIRRTLARHLNLLAVLVWREISVKIKKRFPTEQHIVNAGLMTEEEYQLYEGATSTHGRWFLPVIWIANLLARCRSEGRISDFALQTLLEKLYSYRSTLGMLTVYDWINIPLVYTQVITLATYGYFVFCLVARQSIRDTAKGVDYNKYVDIYFPLFTTLEFLFYVGWLKVGEELRCPFGEDDEDFNMNYVLDRNVHVSNMLIDELITQRPSIGEDVFAEEKYPVLPHTRASYRVRDKVPSWRLSKFKIRGADCERYHTGKSVIRRNVQPQSVPMEETNNNSERY